MHALETYWLRRRAGLKHALFIENAVIGQVDLEAQRLDPAAGQQGVSVEATALQRVGQADQNGGAAVGGLAREFSAPRRQAS